MKIPVGYELNDFNKVVVNNSEVGDATTVIQLLAKQSDKSDLTNFLAALKAYIDKSEMQYAAAMADLNTLKVEHEELSRRLSTVQAAIADAAPRPKERPPNFWEKAPS